MIELGGGISLGLGFGARLGGVALFGDMVMAMITVTWATGINSSTSPPGYQLNMALGVWPWSSPWPAPAGSASTWLIERRVAATE